MGLKATVREALDRPNRRWALIPFATARIMAKERMPCLLWPIKHGWVHWYPSGAFAGGGIGARPPSELDRHAQDIFLHACRLQPGDTVLDVGAGAGEEVRTFSRFVGPTGRVIALEAHPVTFLLLSRNCSTARLTNVELVHRAVTNRSGVVHMTDDGASVGNRVIDSERSVAVPASSLDELAAELKIGRVALMKMNIEGSERLAIEGMSELVQRTDHVCISCHDFLAEEGGDESMRTKEVVRAFLRERGFDVRSREDDPRPWARDYLYGSRIST